MVGVERDGLTIKVRDGIAAGRPYISPREYRVIRKVVPDQPSFNKSY